MEPFRTDRTATAFCKSGKIPSVVKSGRSWQIPDDDITEKFYALLKGESVVARIDPNWCIGH